MRNKIIYSVFLSLFILGGCSDFLDEMPDDRMELETLDQVAEVLVNAYPGTSYLFTDWFSDDVSYIESNSQLVFMTDAFQWKGMETHEDSNCTPVMFWMACYEAIAHANTALEKLTTINGDENYKKAIKGEALLCRAYAHFMIASLWAENYEQETAQTNLGIPYVTEVENVLIKSYSRGTLKETYEKIEKDLLEGISLVSDEYYKGSKRYHFTKNAAKAFACRFYLYKKEYDKTIKYADSILGQGTVNLMYCKDLNEWYNLNVIDSYYDYVDNGDPSNLLIIEKKVGIGLRFGYGYRTDLNLWNYITRSSNPWGGTPYATLGVYGDANRATAKAVKFYEEFYKESLTATIGDPFYVHPVFRGAELVYNRAEAHLMKGEYQLALDDLNGLAPSRFSTLSGTTPELTLEEVASFYQTENIPAAMIQLFLDNKRREFLHEGMRWFDIKRLGLSILHILYNGEEITLEADDKRKVLQIPHAAQSQGIQANPRD